MSKFKSGRVRTSLLAVTALSGFALTGQPAIAQDDGDAVDDTIIVTGSRIPRADLQASSPISVVNQQDITLSGSVLVEDFLNELPQIAPELTSTTNNGGTGASTVDLRALNALSGSPRTLILVNGRRFMSSDEQGRIDVNNIPSALIQRVEVVTGGASSIYGSDAIAGAVNFILKDDFEGVELGGRYGVTDESDGDTYNVNLTIGGDFADGRGNAVVFADYYNRGEIRAGARPFSEFAMDDIGAPNGFITLGSGRIPGGQLNLGAAGGVLPDGSTASTVKFTEDGTPISNDVDGESFNFQPENYLQTPSERFLIFGQSHFEVSRFFDAYMEISYANNRNEQQLAQDANDITDAPPFLQVPLTNPLIAANPDLVTFLSDNFDTGAPGIDDVAGDGIANLPVTLARRMVEVGPRRTDRETDAFRVLIGGRGDLPFETNGSPWQYDAYYSYARTNTSEILAAYTSDIRIQRALQAEPDGLGGAQCIDPAARAGGCVPIRLFGEGDTSLPPAALAYISPTAIQVTETEQHIASVSANGELFELPAGAVQTALGFEYRSEAADFRPDLLLQTGELGPGNDNDPTSGSFNVWEVYGETLVPIVTGQPFFERVELEAAIRYADYTTVGSAVSFGGGGSWTPVEGFKIRGLFQRAVRAPNVAELFEGFVGDSPTFADPCNTAGQMGTAATTGLTVAQIQAFCIAQGVPDPNNFQGDAQVLGTTSGNPNLTEEKANTWTVGMVISPPSMPNFSAVVDYYNITLTDAIDDVNATTTANLCVQSQDLNNFFCQGITRNPFNGQIIRLDQPRVNLGAEEREGIDWEIRYNLDLANVFGDRGFLSNANIDFAHLGNYTLTNTTQSTPDSPPTDCNGIFGGGCTGLGDFAQPEWRLTNNVTLNAGPMSFRGQVRVVGGLTNAFVATISDLAAPDTAVETYLDLATTYDVTENVRLLAGIDNVFDNEPPIIGFGFTGRGGGADANTDPSLYDVIGRRFFFGANVRF